MDELRAEYVVIVRKSSPIGNTVKTFNNLLSAYADIEIEPSKLRHKELEVKYKASITELPDKDIRLIQLKFVCEQPERVDEFDELLKAVRTVAYKTEGQVKLLWDDISLYYSVKAYPIINEIENLMRRLIIQFMLATVGVDWDKEALPKDVKDSIKKKKGGDREVTSILHETDFIVLADCLFKPYLSKEVEQLYQRIEQVKDVSELSLTQLKEYLPRSNWTRYFSAIVNCDDAFLSKRWTELYDLRCLVAHNNVLKRGDFERICTLTNEIKPKLQEAINNIDRVKVPEEEKESVAENIVSNTNELFGEFIQKWVVLETELRRITQPYTPITPKGRLVIPTLMVDSLLKNKVINKEFATQLIEFMTIRNRLLHGQLSISDNDFSESKMREIIGKLDDVLLTLRSL